MSGGGFRVLIPNSARKMIGNIKEIVTNHSDEEIYAMLKECSMDPDETIQKLIFQDPFREVKSKRERRKENASNKESVDSRWKNAAHGRGGKVGSLNRSPRYTSNDGVGGRNSFSGKENGVNQVAEKTVFHDKKNRERNLVKSTLPVIDAGPTHLGSENATEINSFLVATLSPFVATKKSTSSSAKRDSQEHFPSDSASVSMTAVSSSVPNILSSDSMLVPSKDSLFLDAMNSIKCDVGSEQTSSEHAYVNPMVNTEAFENVNTMIEGNTPSKSERIGGNQITEFSQSSTSTHGEPTISRPSSNYNNRPQQIIGSQKVGFNKEWKPKTKNSFGVQSAETVSKAVSPDNVDGTFEAIAHPQFEVVDSEECTKLQQKLTDLHIPQSQLVILPDHIHVPELERTKLKFGSFGVGFELTTTYGSSPQSDKSPTPESESQASLGIEETSDERTSSNQNALATAEEGDFYHSQSPTHVPERFSGEGDISSSVIQECNDLKQETGVAAETLQYLFVHDSQNYNIGFAPPIAGSQLSPFENLDSEPQDASQFPSFVVQQPFDPAGYYAQYYRPCADSDGRLSPFLSPGVSTKYNGNVGLLPQSPKEGGVVSTAGPPALGTQATGLIQSPLAVTQPSVAVFRPPTGMHISHFPPNYIPYGHYFSPYYVPPPIHQLLGNNAFPHQHQAGSIYPTPLPSAAAPVKYSLPPYKSGTNSGNPTHVGFPSGYGLYGSTPSGYNPNSAATGGNATANEDISFKENNGYINGPQGKGSTIWVAAPGREMSGLPANSFYNLPPQGQVTFTPTQSGHSAFGSIYHPTAQAAATVHPLLQQSQAMAGAADMMGPGGNVYQQPQHSQTNWARNY